MRMNDFDRRFSRMNKIFWIMFSVIACVIVAIWIGVATVITAVALDPEWYANKLGTIAAEVIKPIAEAVKETQ